jgi:dihydrodiol dehydrogenase / D-xylose 1-dehydrogenase (NADP)
MADKVRWGIIGCGQIASVFAEALCELEDAELLGVGSRSLDKAKGFAEKFGSERAYGSYAELAVDKDIDVVYVATPHPFHMENTLLCIEADRAVLCEKPFAVNAKEAQRMIDLARAKGVFLMEAMWTRFIPAIVRVRQLLSDGVIGQVRMMQADFGYRFEFDPEQRVFNLELGGGALLDVGVYPVSLASMVFGRQPEAITGLANIGKTGVDEQSAFVLRYHRDELAVLYCAVRTETPGEAVIIGTKGMIKIHYPFWRSKCLTICREGGEDEIIDLPFERNKFCFEAEHVQSCLREGKMQSDIMTLDESLAIMETMDRIREQWDLRYPADEE